MEDAPVGSSEFTMFFPSSSSCLVLSWGLRCSRRSVIGSSPRSHDKNAYEIIKIHFIIAVLLYSSSFFEVSII